MATQLILVDGSSYLHRAFHALPDLRNAKGEPTAALLGVMNMLRRLVKDHNPSHIGVIFDAKGKTFRHTLYPDYKANRKAMPDELRVQIEPLHTMIKLMGLPLLAVPGVEADDVIGTLTLQAKALGYDVLISTGDKDMAQLVGDGVQLIDTMKNVVMDHDYVLKKFGVPPHNIIDYLALTGDASDNIPGVPKVGAKTAAKWLNEYGNIDALVEHADDISGKVGEALRDSLTQLALSKTLATINCDVPLEVVPDQLTLKPMDIDALYPYLRRYEFKTWLKSLAPETVSPSGASPVQYECIITDQDWQRWQKTIKNAKRLAIDTETTSLDAMQAKLVGVSFAVDEQRAAYLPLAHDYDGVPTQLPYAKTLQALKALLEDPNIKKIGQNIKYDYKVLAQHGIHMQGIDFDTMLASYVLDSTQRHNLDDLALRYLNHDTIRFEAVAGKGAKALTFNQISLDVATPYAAEDAWVTFKLWRVLSAKLNESPILLRLFEQEEMPLLTVLGNMELTGVLIDSHALQRQSESLAKKLALLEKQAYSLAGEAFNLNSPKQLQGLLFEKMGLPVIKKTPKGQPSTAEAVLSELAKEYELPSVILTYRHLDKLKSTYTDKLPKQVDAKTGRVHTHYQQAVTSTGRLSSKDPNLQNIPTRSEAGRQIRQAFIAPKGSVLIAADYSQIELRIMAHLSQDPGLINAFNHNEDIHRATAAEVFGREIGAVTKEERRRAKAINFGLIYGMSAFGLSKQLGISQADAKQYMSTYFARYPGVLVYMENTRAKAKQDGYVETLYGRRLYLPDIHSNNALKRMGAERAAINAPMQGTAADIIKRAMIAIDDCLAKENGSATMLMQVHDELVFEVATDQSEAWCQKIRHLTEGAAVLNVPLLVNIDVGNTWKEAH